VECSDPSWSLERLEDAIRQGSHASAASHLGFLKYEKVDFAHKGFWVVLLSPMGVVPQRSRRPWTIVDHTFCGLNYAAIK
jgi:hypothetical protein